MFSGVELLARTVKEKKISFSALVEASVLEHQRVRNRFRFDFNVDQSIFKLHRREAGTVVTAQTNLPGGDHFPGQGNEVPFLPDTDGCF